MSRKDWIAGAMLALLMMTAGERCHRAELVVTVTDGTNPGFGLGQPIRLKLG